MITIYPMSESGKPVAFRLGIDVHGPAHDWFLNLPPHIKTLITHNFDQDNILEDLDFTTIPGEVRNAQRIAEEWSTTASLTLAEYSERLEYKFHKKAERWALKQERPRKRRGPRRKTKSSGSPSTHGR